MRIKKKYVIGIGLLVILIFLGYLSFGKQAAQNKNTITVGIMAGSKSEQEIWDSVAQTAKKRYGLRVKFQRFTDYSQPNAALSSNNIDVNAFQNYPFLDIWNQKNHTNIVSVGDTIIEPMRIYSYKNQSIAKIPNGATITVPNDANNESRALFLLQSAGLIKIKPHTSLATTKDIIKNDKNLKIKEVDASQTARSLNDVGAAIVNGNYAQTVNLNPKKAIFTEPLKKDSHKWINFIAANKENRNDKNVKELVKAYQSPETAKVIKRVSGVNQLPAWDLKLK